MFQDKAKNSAWGLTMLDPFSDIRQVLVEASRIVDWSRKSLKAFSACFVLTHILLEIFPRRFVRLLFDPILAHI